MAMRPEEDSNEGHVSAALGEDPGRWVGEHPTCLLDEGYEESFSFRAARASGIRRFRVNHTPGSRGDFLEALQQLGAEPKIERLQNRRNIYRMMRVHVTCSREEWSAIFGEPECVEETVMPSSKHLLHLWKHTCSDGSVTCIGHLFEQSPGIQRVVVMRVTCL